MELTYETLRLKLQFIARALALTFASGNALPMINGLFTVVATSRRLSHIEPFSSLDFEASRRCCPSRLVERINPFPFMKLPKPEG